MNESAAKAVWTINGWKGLFRPVWAAEFREVKENGRTSFFKTASEAECAAWRVLNTIEQPVMRRDGDRIQSLKASAEKLFMGGGKVVVVEKRGARA